MDNIIPLKAGKREVRVTVLEKRDCSKSFLRILAKGDINAYVSRITADCMMGQNTY